MREKLVQIQGKKEEKETALKRVKKKLKKCPFIIIGCASLIGLSYFYLGPEISTVTQVPLIGLGTLTIPYYVSHKRTEKMLENIIYELQREEQYLEIQSEKQITKKTSYSEPVFKNEKVLKLRPSYQRYKGI